MKLSKSFNISIIFKWNSQIWKYFMMKSTLEELEISQGSNLYFKLLS